MQQEVTQMPNRTIYVADADLPLFEKAQQLSGGNLSSTITDALRQFVEAQAIRSGGFEEVTVKVGKHVHSLKRFQGRLLAKGSVPEKNETRKVSYNVYQTPKGNLVVHIKTSPNWNYWSSHRGRSRRGRPDDWSDTDWSSRGYEYRLEVYPSLEELEFNVPPELHEAVAQILNGDNPDGVEVLDI